MPSYGITLVYDGVTPKLNALIGGVRSGEFRDPVGRATVRVFLDHFADKDQDSESHKTADELGAKRSHLFGAFGRATQHTVEADGFTVSINHAAARQRWKGGVIRPVNAQNLTIAAIGAAYGVRARDAGISLKFAFAFNEKWQRWAPALIAPDAVEKETGKARKDGTRRKKVIKPSGIWYWLVKSVTQAPDDSVLPRKRDITDGIGAALSKWFQKAAGKAGVAFSSS